MDGASLIKNQNARQSTPEIATGVSDNGSSAAEAWPEPWAF